MANNDIIFGALGTMGFTGSIDDRMHKYLTLIGDTNAGCMGDAEKLYLDVLGAPNGCLQDRWFSILGTYGHTGDLTNRINSFWSGGAVLPAHTARINLETGFALLLETGDKLLRE